MISHCRNESIQTCRDRSEHYVPFQVHRRPVPSPALSPEPKAKPGRLLREGRRSLFIKGIEKNSIQRSKSFDDEFRTGKHCIGNAIIPVRRESINFNKMDDDTMNEQCGLQNDNSVSVGNSLGKSSCHTSVTRKESESDTLDKCSDQNSMERCTSLRVLKKRHSKRSLRTPESRNLMESSSERNISTTKGASIDQVHPHHELSTASSHDCSYVCCKLVRKFLVDIGLVEAAPRGEQLTAQEEGASPDTDSTTSSYDV